MNEPTRTRLALAALSTGLAGACAYAALRFYLFLRVGPTQPMLVLRTSSIAYYQALGVAAVLGVVWGLFVLDRLRDEASVRALEHALSRLALPAILVCALACWAFP